MSGKMYKWGETTWFNTWSKRLDDLNGKGNPVLAEIMFDIKTVRKISIAENMFTANVIISVRVPVESLYGKRLSDRKPSPGEPHYVIAPDNEMCAEWSPWIEVSGKLSNKWHWSRLVEDNTKILYSTELEGDFPMNGGGRGYLYPFDFHELQFQVTSNWDATKLVFVPWDAEWRRDAALAALEKSATYCVRETSRVRDQDMDNSLGGLWTFTRTPRTVFRQSTGLNRKHTYTECSGSILVKRKWITFAMFELLRPLFLAALAPIAETFFDTPSTRLTFNVSILIAMSVAFMRSAETQRVTVADFYRIGAFFFAGCILLVAIAPAVNDWSFQNVTWLSYLTFAGLHVALLLFVLVSRVKYWDLLKKHRPTTPLPASTSVQVYVEDEDDK